MSAIFQLTRDDIDQLSELINIGVSHAGTTLSIMSGKRVTISVPSVAIKSAEGGVQFIEKADDVTIAVLLRISGGLEGYMFFFFPHDTAIHLLQVLSGKTVGDLRALTRFDRSIFQELGNVITGGMLQGLSKFLHLQLIHSVPDVVVDMSGAMFNSLSAAMIALNEEFLSLDVAICVDAAPGEVACKSGDKTVGRMFFFVGPDAARQILSVTRKMIGAQS